MKSPVIIFAVFASTFATVAQSVTPDKYIDHIANLTDYTGRISYSILLPQAELPVIYEIKMSSTAVDTDTLAPCRYLLEWVPEQEENGAGFAAYIDGAHYRYRGKRLQEYHVSWDSIPFLAGNGGVQCNAQFVDALPQFLGRELKRLMTDSNFVYTFSPDTIYNGRRAAVVCGKLMHHGYVSKEAAYIFDQATLMPVAVELENNPGSVSEQSVSIKYNDCSTALFPIKGEESLIAMYPEVFEKYRESNFRVENLPGTHLPTFSGMMHDGERYNHHHGDTFVTPVVIAIVDDSGANTSSTIASLRKAVDSSPVQFDLMMAFVSADTERALDIAGRCRHGEILLTSAKALARDCGVSAFPTLLYVDRDGRVCDVTLGFNQNLTDVVIQTATLCFR